MKKHNFEFSFLSDQSALLGISFRKVDVKEVSNIHRNGYMIEVGIFFATFVYLYCID